MYPVFYLHPLDKSELALRRYASKACPLMSGSYSYHNAQVPIGEGTLHQTCGDLHPHDDPRWPTQCDCGYTFEEKDDWQLFSRRLYRRSDNGQETTIHDAPVGACWNDDYKTETRTYPDFYIGEDGRCLVLKTPGGSWYIDSRASNCTLPDDKTHKCWIRHGSPEIPGSLHVDKNGHTCAAGAGSIISGSFHGFCHHGNIVSC